MAEAFVVLGIAANIAQFVSYGLHLLSDGKEIYNSAHGERDEHRELEAIIEDIRNISEEIPMRTLSGQSNDEKAVRKLAAECGPLADKLSSILNDLKVPDDARFRALQAVRQAIKSAVRRRDVHDLKRRLAELDIRLRTRASRMLQKDNHSEVMLAIDALYQSDELLKADLASNLDQLRDDIMDSLDTKAMYVAKVRGVGLETLSRQLLSLSEEGRRIEYQQQILNSLTFEEMKQRDEAIKDAHETTLDWIFKKPEMGFMNWLEAENGFYWVRGKAGSGKSTLMKYICVHETTLKALKAWAGSQNLVTASFFFWNAGLPMQKSKLGLLQSLLFQIFLACPSLIIEIFPTRLNQPWTQKELLKTLDRISKDLELSSKFCFFIDGLDEYEGDEEDIVNLLQSLASLPNVKICVSSRPWNAFMDAFSECRWKLILEDLTKDDMRKYVHAMLVKSKVFAKIAEKDSRCQTLMPQIADKAQGVWLWVYLVVRDLLRDLRGEEEFPLLQRRLDSFPEELEKYFADIIDRIDKIHQEESAKIFLMTVKAEGPIPAIALKCLAMEQADSEYALKIQIQPLYSRPKEELSKWGKLLNSRCRDLLELKENPGPGIVRSSPMDPVLACRIEFLHRTVRDFLRDNYQTELQNRAENHFDAHTSLCKIMLVVIKAYQSDASKERLEAQLLGFVDEMLWYAWEIERKGSSDITLLDELDRVLSHFNHEIRKICGHEGHWTNMRVEATVENTSLSEHGHCTFLALAIQEGLHLYVERKLDECPELIVEKKGRPLLDYCLRPPRRVFGQLMFLNNQQQYDYRYVNTKILSSLLSRGADPNSPVLFHLSDTIWSLFLKSCAPYNFRLPEKLSAEVKKSWYEASILLIDHGADMNLARKLLDRGGSPVWKDFQKLFGPERANRLVAREVQEPHGINLQDLEEIPSKLSQASFIRRLFGWF